MDLTNYPRIKIKGVDGIFVLFGTEEDAPVTTQEDVDDFVPGYGHMYNGTIKRYGNIVCGREGWSYVTEAESVRSKKRLQANTQPKTQASPRDQEREQSL